MLDLRERDALGAELRPGDICIRVVNSKIEPVVYRGRTRGNASKGKFGRFYTLEGKTSIKFSNVILAFDPLSDRRNSSEAIAKLIRKYYEGLE